MNPPHRFRWIALFPLAMLIGAFAGSVCGAPPTRPNIIVILADDLGWAELGCYGNRFHETPHLDRLAATGMRFTNAYAAAPVCSPYRAALLTGQHPARIGIVDYLRPNSANALPAGLVTLPEVLQRHGYATGAIGKWHLSGYTRHGAEHELTPADHGFSWDFGREVKGVGNGANFWPYVFRDQPFRWIDIPDHRLGEDEYLTDRLNLEAVEFIERHRDEPFFLYLSHYAPHTILNGRPDLVEKYRRKHPPGKSTRERCYLCEDAGRGRGDPGHHWAGDHNPHLAAMLESIDDGVGRITAKLDELGLAENTIVIFTSDNGGETNVTSNHPLRGGKSQLYEGGVRVPLVVRWPQVIPAGAVSEQPTQNIDFYPTLLDAAKIAKDPSHKLDGVSTLSTWRDPTKPREREFLAWHYPLDRPHFLGGVSGGAIRIGDWKLVEQFDSGKLELFSLKDDPGESRDLAAQQPERVERMHRQLVRWRETVDARIPSPPLLSKPKQLQFAEHFNPPHLSKRLWYNADWKAEDGVLKRLAGGSGNTRIFLREASYGNAIIRFDFQLGNSQDVRLMTGEGGHYNTVLHIRPDHFYLQTAKDPDAPHFSYRHSECAYDFQPDRWYTMTIEFMGDEAVAHLDHDHLAYAKHPMIARTRKYLALQVDKHAAQFDNLQLLAAARDESAETRRQVIDAVNRFPVKRSPEEQFELLRSNAHEWYYQRDAEYRRLVERVAELDEARKRRFPNAFRSHKETRKSVLEARKQLLKTDPLYKETLFATHRANRAVDKWLVEREPQLAELPNNRRKAALDRLRRRLADHPELIRLVEQAKQAEAELEAKYPQLFPSDEQINAEKRAAHETLRRDPEFERLNQQRAAAYRAQQQYLLENDEPLLRLQQKLQPGTP